MKHSIEWHKKCLENSQIRAERLRIELRQRQFQLELLDSNNLHLSAKIQGSLNKKTHFDSERKSGGIDESRKRQLLFELHQITQDHGS